MNGVLISYHIPLLFPNKMKIGAKFYLTFFLQAIAKAQSTSFRKEIDAILAFKMLQNIVLYLTFNIQ